ncbi:hypothetical protein PG22511B_0112 [Bifidobacterium pseudolongum subsp. globosum]|nr:hypothetical protein PG22511B_0112 [Bifidobacterium pseudolongum subsp. globosum]
MHARPEMAFGLACNGAVSVRLVDTSADTGLALYPRLRQNFIWCGAATAR